MSAALVGLAAWAVLCSGLSPETLALASALLLVLMAAAMTAGTLESPVFAGSVALSWVSAASVSTAIALIQYFGLAENFAPWVSGSVAGEAFANLRQRNQFASLTVIGMASLFWLAPRYLGRWPALAVMAWLAVGNAATTSRTGLGQIIALGLLACLWPGPRRARMALWAGGLLAYSLAAIALPWLLEMFSGVAGGRLWDRVAAVDACSSRIVLWSNVLHLIAQKPWLGWGWGELDYAHYMTLYDGARFCDILDNAHSLPLHLAVELGLPAALLVCGGLAVGYCGATPWREADPARQMAWAALAVIVPAQPGRISSLVRPVPDCIRLVPGPVVAGGRRSASIDEATPGWQSPRWRRLSWPPVSTPPGTTAVSARSTCRPKPAAQEYRDDPLREIRRSWLFRGQARFAELTITPLTRDNAQWTFDTAAQLLHFSPEPRVIEKLIESGGAAGAKRGDAAAPGALPCRLPRGLCALGRRQQRRPRRSTGR